MNIDLNYEKLSLYFADFVFHGGFSKRNEGLVFFLA